MTDVIGHFLEPVFEDSQLAHIHPSDGAEWLGLLIGGADLDRRHRRSPTSSTSPARARARRLMERLRPVHTFLFNKWYFDEAIDFLIYRPAIAIGRFSSNVFERFVVNGLVSGTVGVVRGAGGVVRGAQSGFVRSYALLLVGGFAGLGLYFLVVAS